MTGATSFTPALTSHLSELSDVAQISDDVLLQAQSEAFLEPGAERDRRLIADEAWAMAEADSYIVAAKPVDQQEIEKLAAEVDF